MARHLRCPDGRESRRYSTTYELELVSSGERWGRGPKRDIHSSNKAMVDTPAWHLVQALNTLVSADGNTPAIEHYADKARPLSDSEKKMLDVAAARMNAEGTKRSLGVDHWIHDVSWREALEMLVSRPTVNIEGLVGGYTGREARPSSLTRRWRSSICGWCLI